MDILPVPRYLFICAFPCDLSVAVIKMTLFKVTSAKRVDPGNWAQRSSSRLVCRSDSRLLLSAKEDYLSRWPVPCTPLRTSFYEGTKSESD